MLLRATARPAPLPAGLRPLAGAANAAATTSSFHCNSRRRRRRRSRPCQVAAAAATSATVAAAAAIAAEAPPTNSGHAALLHGLGAVGDVPPKLMPFLLRLAHVKSKTSGADAQAALEEGARGLLAWKAALSSGLLPDDAALAALTSGDVAIVSSGGSGGSSSSSSSPLTGLDPASLRWPSPPLRAALCRDLAKLGAPRFCSKYPAVLDAMLKTVVEAAHKHAALTAPKEIVLDDDEGDEGSEGGVGADGKMRRRRGGDLDSQQQQNGPKYLTAKQLAEEEEARRRARAAADGKELAPSATTTAENAAERLAVSNGGGGKNNASSDSWTAAPRAAAELATVVDEDEAEAARERAEALAAMPLDVRAAEALAASIVQQWGPPLETLSRAGKAFEGLEGLLGGAGGASGFDLSSGLWRRKGWGEMDAMRSKLEHLKELRDLVRSLGRGGGWGPLRRAPVQHLDERGRPGLLRTTLEAQETRGLSRSDDISRLLPSEAAMLARGRTVRASKLLFYAKLAEKALQTYERDGWGEFDTRIPDPDRREVRPTADRGPILLCVDTSGSMRGPREVVAKALALECMRAAKVQERGCYVFAFAGPAEVAELELGMDAASVDRLLGFLEKVFNGGSDFNTPIAKCLDRLHDRAWANSDILIVSDGELRQPAQELMRKLAGAKEKLGLRVHGLVVGAASDDAARKADPAVLRSLCSCVLPNGKVEHLVHVFENWSGVQSSGDASLAAIDWDDAAGNAARRKAGMALEEAREAEARRLRVANKHLKVKAPPSGGRKKKKDRGAEAVVGKSAFVEGMGGGGQIGGEAVPAGAMA